MAEKAPQTTDSIQLVAVQMSMGLSDYWSAEAFELKIRQLMDEVAAKMDASLPTLVVFPEDVGLMLAVQGLQKQLSGAKGIADAITRATRAKLLPVVWARLTKGLSWVPALFLQQNKVIASTYFDVFSRMARAHNVYLVAGSVVLPPYEIIEGKVAWEQGPLENRVFNASFCFDPNGMVIGAQAKVHLIGLEQEEALHLAAAPLEELQVFETPLGRIGIGICLDAFQDEVAASLQDKGAQILVQPSANPAPWDKDQQIDWLRGSHQKTVREGRFAYAVNPMMNGVLWDVLFFGQSSIIDRQSSEPKLGYSALQPNAGFIAMASSDRSEEILVAKVPHPSSLNQ